uniref:Syndecan binding protein (syntenin) 2 n=1 Tax=Sinocyclocheilus grahami TaxID=75366 RepID=A0A672RC20_SINGR
MICYLNIYHVYHPSFKRSVCLCHMENSKLQYETPSLSLPPALYPNLEELGDYMGLSLNSDEVQRNLALVPVTDNQVAVPSCVGGMVRPVTGADMGIRRAEIRPGLREVIICKDQEGKVGLRLRDIDNVSKALCIKHFFRVRIASLLQSSVSHDPSEIIQIS